MRRVGAVLKLRARRKKKQRTKTQSFHRSSHRFMSADGPAAGAFWRGTFVSTRDSDHGHTPLPPLAFPGSPRTQARQERKWEKRKEETTEPTVFTIIPIVVADPVKGCVTVVTTVGTASAAVASTATLLGYCALALPPPMTLPGGAGMGA